MKLADILHDTPTRAVRGPVDRTFKALRYDSRQVEENDVFFAWKGEKTDGHRYIVEVCDRGAAAVVLENPAVRAAHGPTFIEVDDARRAMATMAATFFGRPDRALEMVGVTGTNGKTTTTFILKHLLDEPSAPVGLIGTVRYEIGERMLPAARTTPESLDLHELLARCGRPPAGRGDGGLLACAGAGPRAADRVSGRHLHEPDAGPSRLSRHDGELFRGEAEAVRESRSREREPGTAVINLDDAHGAKLARRLSARVRVLGYLPPRVAKRGDRGQRAAGRMRPGPEGTLRIDGDGRCRSRAAADRLLQRGQRAGGGRRRAGARARAAADLERLRDTPQVPGRLEKFVSRDGVHAVVDYAHTDDAVRKALPCCAASRAGRLIVVLGCGGNRDAAKRPLMARAAVEAADYAIFTADNPRNERGDRERHSRADGGRRGAAPARQISRAEPDRRQAIAHALALAKPGDVVCVAGKGHETTQEIAGSFIPSTTGSWCRNFCAGGKRVKRR